jgi:hypothetical protein
LTGIDEPKEDAQSTSIESPGFRYDLEGSNFKNGNRSPAILGIEKYILDFISTIVDL